MKRKTVFIILITLFLTAILCSCINEQRFFTLKYTADEGGVIEGTAEQTAKEGESGSPVTAVANEGYEFVKWSDGIETTTRQDKNIQQNISVTAQFRLINDENKSYTITYLVEEGGTLEGETVQTISEEIYTTNVIVRVQDGYEFIGWSDGNMKYSRQDYHDHQDKTFTAQIRRIDDYKLMDWYTEYGVGVPTIKINEDTYENLNFPIPTREHFTFEGWYFGDTLVADAQGRSYFTKDMLTDGDRDIVAKWTSYETYTYKILLVYVTRIDANLQTMDQTSKIHVDYTISDLEREFYHWTTIRLKQYLDDMVDGIVEFQIDEYYTTETVVTEDFIYMGPVGSVTNYLDADQIPEVKDLVKEYDSALSVFSINDINYKLHSMSGSAKSRYGQIYFDSFLSALKTYKFTLEQVVNFLKDCNISDLLQYKITYNLTHVTSSYWFYTFVHELAHTIETRINGDNWHNIENELSYKQNMNGYNPCKYYYLQAVLHDDKKVGIPYEFWSGDIMKVHYDVQGIGSGYDGGYIKGNGHYTHKRPGAADCIYDVPYGYDAPAATAIPRNGYEFVEWSDGVKTATRTDTNITEDKTIIAIFKPLTYQLTVVASEGGKIVRGEGTCELQIGGKSVGLTAEANEGYVFVGWSDGELATRDSFRINSSTVALFDENRQYTLTAIFVKIDEPSDYYVLNLTRCDGRYSVEGLVYEKAVLMKKDIDTLQVSAWAEVGYRFVAWSDGNTEQRRIFTINSDLIALSDENYVITVYAIFEKTE